MEHRKRYLLLAVVYLVGIICVGQAPFMFSHADNSTPHGFVQPSNPDFTRWIVTPVYYQNNDENCHGFGLIPSPVNPAMMTTNNGSPYRYQHLFFQKPAKIRYEFF